MVCFLHFGYIFHHLGFWYFNFFLCLCKFPKSVFLNLFQKLERVYFLSFDPYLGFWYFGEFFFFLNFFNFLNICLNYTQIVMWGLFS